MGKPGRNFWRDINQLTGQGMRQCGVSVPRRVDRKERGVAVHSQEEEEGL